MWKTGETLRGQVAALFRAGQPERPGGEVRDEESCGAAATDGGR